MMGSMDAEEIRRTLTGLQTAPLERAPDTVAILEATIDAAGIDYADAVAGRKGMTANRGRTRTTPRLARSAGSKSQSRASRRLSSRSRRPWGFSPWAASGCTRR